jgi:hypothetical protein
MIGVTMRRSLLVIATAVGVLGPAPLAGQRLPDPLPGGSAPALTQAERDSALGALRLQGAAAVPEKRLLLGATEVVAVNLLVWSYNRYLADAYDAYPNGDTIYWARVSPESWKQNLQEGFDWDDNQFSNNQIAHPYHGNLYFNAARSNGFTYWESWPFALLGSWTWEYFGETYRPAYNDWINTSLGGIALGEMLHRASAMVLDNTATGGSRTWKEIGAALLNPVQGFTRLVTGDWSRVGPNPADRMPSRVRGRAYAGARYVGDRSLDQTEGQAFLELGMIYGDPFDAAIRKPFEAFDLYLQLTSRNAKPISRLQTKGILAVGDLSRSDRSALVVGAFHHFDYMNTAAGEDSIGFEYGGQSFGAGLLYRTQLSERWSLGAAFYPNVVVLGATSTDMPGTLGRSYDYGPGFAYKAEAVLRYRDWTILQLNNGLTWTFTANGSEGDHLTRLFEANLVVPVFRDLGIGATAALYKRKSFYDGVVPDTEKENPQLRFFIATR